MSNSVDYNNNEELKETSLKKEENPIIVKLKKALRSDGDFPVRARVITELRILSSKEDTSINTISDIILKEPALGTRVLHLVNSAFYQRNRPITTISQAVIHIGMRTLSDLCAGLVLLQRFRPIAKRGGIFTENLKKSILTSLIASSLASESDDPEISEYGYLAGAFYGLGPLLLAFYFPHIYEAAGKRAINRGHNINQSISEILGIEQIGLSKAILEALKIPEFYHQVLIDSYKPIEETASKNFSLGHTIAVSGKFSDILIDSKKEDEVKKEISKLSEISNYEFSKLNNLVLEIPKMFEDHCTMIDMSFLTLPEFLNNFNSPLESKKDDELLKQNDRDNFTSYIDEIKESIINKEPISSIITTAMETLVYSLSFDRVLLLLINKSKTRLEGKMSLGTSFDINIKDYAISLTNNESPAVIAINKGAPNIFGTPLFKDNWPFAIIPIGSKEKCLGVIYADIILNSEKKRDTPIDEKDKAALYMINDLLDKASLSHY